MAPPAFISALAGIVAWHIKEDDAGSHPMSVQLCKHAYAVLVVEYDMCTKVCHLHEAATDKSSSGPRHLLSSLC